MRQQQSKLASQADFFFTSPPCNSFSRATWRRKGPKPVRSFMYPHRFPWLNKHQREKADQANLLIAYATICMQHKAAQAAPGAHTVAAAEHPEDLGNTIRGDSSSGPASWWQFPDAQGTPHTWSAAFLQCSYGAPYETHTYLGDDRPGAHSRSCWVANFQRVWRLPGPDPDVHTWAPCADRQGQPRLQDDTCGSLPRRAV